LRRSRRGDAALAVVAKRRDLDLRANVHRLGQPVLGRIRERPAGRLLGAAAQAVVHQTIRPRISAR
jgi:hypothetical protein